MVKKHLKRLAIPKSWDIRKKKNKFTTRPMPGAHSFELGIPLNLVIRDLLKYAKNNHEVKKILNNKEILVDGKIRKDYRFITGFMDSISIPKLKKNYRVILNKKGKLFLLATTEQEAKIKICKIIGKKLVKGKTQLNLFDSRNVLVEKDNNKVGDSVVIELPTQKIKEHLKLEKGASIFVMGGKKIGTLCLVEDIINRKIICKHNNTIFEVPFDYIFVVGKNKPLIKLEKEKWMLWEIWELRKLPLT